MYNPQFVIQPKFNVVITQGSSPHEFNITCTEAVQDRLLKMINEVSKTRVEPSRYSGQIFFFVPHIYDPLQMALYLLDPFGGQFVPLHGKPVPVKAPAVPKPMPQHRVVIKNDLPMKIKNGLRLFFPDEATYDEVRNDIKDLGSIIDRKNEGMYFFFTPSANYDFTQVVTYILRHGGIYDKEGK